VLIEVLQQIYNANTDVSEEIWLQNDDDMHRITQILESEADKIPQN
jgi:hypothetical protein